MSVHHLKVLPSFSLFTEVNLTCKLQIVVTRELLGTHQFIYSQIILDHIELFQIGLNKKLKSLDILLDGKTFCPPHSQLLALCSL
jgi:hypothetical protein